MTYISTQSSLYAELPNGRVKKAFHITKGTPDKISQIRGVSNNTDPNTYHITSNMKRYNRSTGIMHSKHKSYRLKASEMKELLKNEEDENNEEENNEEEKPVKKVVKKAVKKTVKKTVKKDETSTSKAKKPKATKPLVSGEKKKEVKKKQNLNK